MATYRSAQVLDWRHPLQLREPANGFASRLAALNGRPMRNFLREMRIRPYSLDQAASGALASLALIGGADPAQLNRFTPSAVDKKFYAVGGETLGRLSVNRTYFNYCPRCVLEDIGVFEGPINARPWLRLQWVIFHYRSCDTHNVLLEPYHPTRRRFQPFDFSEAIAELLPNLENLASKPVRAKPSAFQHWLSDRLGGIRDEKNWLDDVPLYAAIEFCETLGLSALHHPKVRTSKLSVQQWAEGAEEGYRIASGGVDPLLVLLERLNHAQASTRGFWGPRDTYGHVYGMLQKTILDPSHEKFRQVIRDFAISTMPIEPGTDVLGTTVKERVIHTIRTASRDSGAHALTIRKLFEKKGITEGRYESGLADHRVTVEASEIRSVVESLKIALSTPQVEKITGIPRIPLKMMIAAGHLPTVTGSTGNAYAKHRFSKAEVDKLMQRLFEGAEVVRTPLSRQLPVQEARLVACATNPQILAMIMEGKLKWKGRLEGVSDYMGLLLDADEVKRLVRSSGTKSGLTKLEAKKLIPGMGRDSVGKFIRDGQLETIEEFNPEARRMSTVISRESAEKFMATYVSLGELSQKSGLHHKQVRLLLRTVGIEAFFDPNEYQSFFYLREDVESVQQGNLRFWQYEKGVAQASLKHLSTRVNDL